MWTGIIEVFLKKYLEKFTPRRKVAKEIYSLYQSMKLCHESYLNYIDHRNDENFYKWSYSFLLLHFEFVKVKDALHIYDIPLYENIMKYNTAESSSLSIESKSLSRDIELELNQMNFLILKKNLEKLKKFKPTSMLTSMNLYLHQGEKDFDPDFLNAIKRLEDFIRLNFTIDELL